MKYAVITGASSGLGKEYVKKVFLSLKDIDKILIIARREERLKQLRDELGEKIEIFPADITDSNSVRLYEEYLRKNNADVKLLINNAGFGYFKSFMDRPLEDWLRLVDLNSKAMVSLSYRMIKYMEKGSEIYNTCSSSAFQPVPYIAVYGASKSFALNFTRAINMELKPKGIRAIAVCPHWTKTEFFDTAGS